MLAGRPAETTVMSTTTRSGPSCAAELAAGSSKKDAVAAVSQRLGATRKTVYALCARDA